MTRRWWLGWILTLVACATSPASAQTMALSPAAALSCAVHAGTVRCWGTTAANGGLGTGASVTTRVPVVITGIVDATAVAVGSIHGCALRSGGGVKCWGGGQAGQLGNGTNTISSPNPVDVTGLAGPAQALVANDFTNCALIQGGAVQCWGSDSPGTLGDGAPFANSNVPVSVTGVTTATAIAAGPRHVCVTLADGTARCWGDNAAGALGDNSTVMRNAPVVVSGLSGATRIATGESHSCALTTAGLRCWGSNLFGQLGTGTFAPSLVPVAANAVNAANVQQLVAAGRHTCARMSDGSVQCWGRNFDGQLGQADNSVFSATGVTIQGLPGPAISIAAGTATTCVRLAEEDIRCVGSGTFSQLGDGRQRRWLQPVASALPTDADLDMGSQHTCARTSTQLACVGYNGAGALGDGTTARRLVLTPVVGTGAAGSTLAASETQTCNYVQGTTSSQCWGRNESAQIGTASATAQEPFAVGAPQLGAGRQIAQIALGTFFGCALTIEDSFGDPVKRVRCWGRNAEGQLGNGTFIDTTAPNATPVAGLDAPIAIGAGELHACALESNGTVKCWGNNQASQLGTGSMGVPPRSATVLQVATIVDANLLVVARDGRHTCVRRSDDTARCWGFGQFGQLGDGNAAGSVPTPVTVTGVAGITTITAGQRHTCALHGGAVRCWGTNQFDQLGANGIPGDFVPRVVDGLASGVLELAGGAQHSCARLADGWRCWGYNGHGELANGEVGVALLPVRVLRPGTLFMDGFD